MNRLIDAFFKSGQQSLNNADRLNDEAEARARSMRTQHGEHLVQASDKVVKMMEEQQESRKARREESLVYQNERLRQQNLKLTEALDRAEAFARSKFLECEGLTSVVAHLNTVWNTPEADELLSDSDKMGDLIYKKTEEATSNQQKRELAERVVDNIVDRPGRQK
ncbi:MAG: hypothetical protein ACRER5_16125 [Pseudomonas sp.]